MTYGVLGTAPCSAFNRLAAQAARHLEAPVALVCFVARERQWFKARVGLTLQATPREHAFCAYTILDDEVLVVPDATQDPRFADNPLVQGEPYIRFYAGAPLRVRSGAVLGTLCVLDQRPRTLGAYERSTLRALARQVVIRLEIGKALAEIMV